jgi:hypothetical protein
VAGIWPDAGSLRPIDFSSSMALELIANVADCIASLFVLINETTALVALDNR